MIYSKITFISYNEIEKEDKIVQTILNDQVPSDLDKMI